METNLGNKYQKELQNIKNNRRKDVLETARRLFLSKGIDLTTFNDIAEETKVGVASVYRYFGTKQEIAIAVAELVMEDYVRWEKGKFQNIKTMGTGKEKLRLLFLLSIELFNNQPEFIRFVGDFDNFVQKERISSGKLKIYDRFLMGSFEHYKTFFIEGQKDKSISEGKDSDLFLFTVRLSLMTLSRKLLSDPLIVESDKRLRGADHLKCLIDLSMHSL